jgi:hypothetical protein
VIELIEKQFHLTKNLMKTCVKKGVRKLQFGMQCENFQNHVHRLAINAHEVPRGAVDGECEYV